MKLKTLLMGAVASTALAPMAFAEAHEGERGRDGHERQVRVALLAPDHGVRDAAVAEERVARAEHGEARLRGEGAARGGYRLPWTHAVPGGSPRGGQCHCRGALEGGSPGQCQPNARSKGKVDDADACAISSVS